jgi:L-ascorbate metabolism protein UlaG (beta-lactamase superfamily)
LSENPHGAIDPAAVPCDYALCTHAHADHLVLLR